MKNSFNTLICVLFIIIFTQNINAQCFEIQSILVDACGGEEGLNEMVRFKIGANALDTKNLNVSWANTSNPWTGIIQNNETKAIVEGLNADILAAGGCGKLIEPKNDILPANATVILITSYVFDYSLNSFGALTEDYYVIFQNNSTNTSGHFANGGSGIRDFSMAFGSTCKDAVSYDRNILEKKDGATVVYTPNGNATYVNYGCKAPVPPFEVDADSITTDNSITVCNAQTLDLNGKADGYSSIKWSASSGAFSDDTSLISKYTIDANDVGKTITLTLTASNSCKKSITSTLNITISKLTDPIFSIPTTICTGTTAPLLKTTSDNGIKGKWSPTVISNTTDGVYTFTPDANQCAASYKHSITISNGNKTPDFDTIITICEKAIAPNLALTSPNGISGTWNPTTISNTKTGSSKYIFTPSNGQCALPVELTVTVTANTVPNFSKTLSLCKNDSSPILAKTDSNGVVGNWVPSIVDNTQNGSYIFIPDAGQCATNHTLEVNVITTPITPDFNNTLSICSGATAPILEPKSPNQITGSWSPNIIDTLNNGSYLFTPNAGQCAASMTLLVTIKNKQNPEFEFGNTKTHCFGDVSAQVLLPSPSKNNIDGTWNPSTIDNSKIGNTTYKFTPNPSSCGNTFDLVVTVIDRINPTFDAIPAVCSGTSFSLPTNSKEGYAGNWTPSVDNTQTTTYTFKPTNTCSNDANLEVKVNPIPQVTIATICDFDELKLSANMNDKTNTAFNWTDLTNANLGNGDSLIITKSGTYTVNVTQNNCSNSISTIVNSSDFCTIQKGISTNNDGANDSFDLSKFKVNKLQIFNRMGMEVFSKMNYSDEWKGTTESGQDLPDGTYYYIISLDNERIKSGWIYKTNQYKN